MVLNKDFLVGFLSGTVVGAVGYRLYEQNGGQLQRLIQPQGAFNPQPTSATQSPYQPTLEELVLQKERLEDMIAERQAK